MEQVFSTKERIQILEAIIFKTELIGVNAIATQIRLSKGLVSKYLNILVKQGILERHNGKFSIAESSMVKVVKILLNIRSFDTKLFKKYPFIESAGLYGSGARGENTEDSDIDIWLKIKKTDDRALASLTSELNKKAHNIKVLFLTEDKINTLKKEDSLFYYSLVFGSIILYGDKDGIQL